MTRRPLTRRIDWNGITVELSYEPNYWPSTAEERIAFLQIRSVAPARAPLPVTETGYLAHYVREDSVTEQGGPIAFVRAWLDEAATCKAWRDQQEAARQLCLL